MTTKRKLFNKSDGIIGSSKSNVTSSKSFSGLASPGWRKSNYAKLQNNNNEYKCRNSDFFCVLATLFSFLLCFVDLLRHLEALPVDDGWTGFIVLLLCDPHLLEGGQ